MRIWLWVELNLINFLITSSATSFLRKKSVLQCRHKIPNAMTHQRSCKLVYLRLVQIVNCTLFTVTEECQLKHIEEVKMMHHNYRHASFNESLGDFLNVSTLYSVLAQTYIVQPTAHLGSILQPIAPRLQTCTACHCNEYCRQL